jgi:hypothetical protein
MYCSHMSHINPITHCVPYTIPGDNAISCTKPKSIANDYNLPSISTDNMPINKLSRMVAVRITSKFYAETICSAKGWHFGRNATYNDSSLIVKGRPRTNESLIRYWIERQSPLASCIDWTRWYVVLDLLLQLFVHCLHHMYLFVWLGTDWLGPKVCWSQDARHIQSPTK